LLRTREEFLGESWLKIYNRTIYVRVPRTMGSNALMPNEKVYILEKYFLDVAKQIKSGYNKRRGTGKFIGYPINEYISNYRKRVPNYDTSKMVLDGNPQNVKRYEIKEDYFVYD